MMRKKKSKNLRPKYNDALPFLTITFPSLIFSKYLNTKTTTLNKLKQPK